MEVHIASDEIIESLLEAESALLDMEGPEEIDLKEMLVEILRSANDFVPSESGSILLNDSILGHNSGLPETLCFVACYGDGADKLVGIRIAADTGIVGATYTNGEPYISKTVDEDKHFFPGIDKKTHFTTKSIICVPIKLKEETIGTIELLNKSSEVVFEEKDLNLLKVFASYTSTLIQNSLDAKRFEELSIRDNLTGLYNDRFFYDQLNDNLIDALANDKELCLIFFDLDHFKDINDAHGHLAGSRVLTEIGRILDDIETDKDVTIVRYGGDEFVIIMPDCKISEASDYGEKIRERIEKFVFLRQRDRFIAKKAGIGGVITASVGISSLRNSTDTTLPIQTIMRDLIRKADKAMYDAKETGRNKVVTTSASRIISDGTKDSG